MSVAALDVRHRVHDAARVAVRTAPGPGDRHVHCAVFDGESGDGATSPGPDGHVHEVVGLEVQEAAGHCHEMSARRCDERHNERGAHVRARRR